MYNCGSNIYWSKSNTYKNLNQLLNSIPYKAASSWKFKHLSGQEQLQPQMASGREGHVTRHCAHAVTLDPARTALVQCVGESVFLVGQDYFFQTHFLHIYRGRLFLN